MYWQVAVYFLIVRMWLTDMSNRVEHQKRNQPAIEKWPFGLVFGIVVIRAQLGPEHI